MNADLFEDEPQCNISLLSTHLFDVRGAPDSKSEQNTNLLTGSGKTNQNNAGIWYNFVLTGMLQKDKNTLQTFKNVPVNSHKITKIYNPEFWSWS